jgi:transketolase
MRDAFVRALTAAAERDARVVLLSADLGYRLFDDFDRRFPRRFYNVGVAEANMISVAAGLALAGKRPFTYSIATFATARCFEQIRNDLCEMDLPVVIVGVGGGYAYGANGPTHHGIDDIAIMRSLPGMTIIAPCDPREVENALHTILQIDSPVYLRLGRAGEPILPGTDAQFVLGVPNWLRRGERIALVACGPIAGEALRAADDLACHGFEAAVLSAHTAKPVGSLLDSLAGFEHVFVIEEHGPCGGLFEALAAAHARNASPVRTVAAITAPDRFQRTAGSCSFLRRVAGLESTAIAGEVLRRVEKGT